jgi:AraC-like DNA-binding protein
LQKRDADALRLKPEEPKGLLDRKHSESKFQLTRFEPSDAEIAYFVSHYWVVSWDLLRGETYESENLPYPNVHLVFHRGASGIFGVTTRKFVRRLEGRDQAFGVSFRPGGFHPLAATPIWRFTDRRTEIDEVFGPAGRDLEERVLSVEGAAARIALAEAFVRNSKPPRDEAIALVNRVTERIAADRTVVRVEDAANEAGLSRRQLERLFRTYVGVSPKWVIQRYRLFEAADRLAAEPDVNLAGLAVELGYFDQSHFIRDFKAMVGASPARYARRAG